LVSIPAAEHSTITAWGREGDTLVFTKLDRLARSQRDLHIPISAIKWLSGNQVNMVN